MIRYILLDLTIKRLFGLFFLWVPGLEINEKFQSQLYDRIPKFSRNLATFSRRIFARLFALHFPVSGLVTFLFRKSRVKISCKFATSPDILVAKGKN